MANGGMWTTGVFLLFLVFIEPGALLTLNRNGGYDLSIAIDESTPPPDYGPVLYFNKVRLLAQTLSNGMWFVTNKTFFINSVELLLPRSWDTVVFPAKTQSYEQADVRVSHKFQYLRAENPNLCGLPGQFIETPRDFFDNTGYTSKYGTPWKALLTQWARYRWGIWEEHGYPGDARFPYFYRKPGSDGWSVTGCSDVKLEGEYRTLDNKTCRAEGDEYPGDDCRFYPDWQYSPATTSIMHFHWIENVAQLCDEKNHDREAPNRQNRNCGHRSSWEVIRDSPDFKYANEARPIFIPTLEIKVYQRSAYPRLLVLLDKGQAKVSHELRLSVQVQLGKLFEKGRLPGEVVAKIANYPAQNSTSEPPSVISTEVEWESIADGPFISALNSTRSWNSDREDFGLAIEAAVRECRSMNHDPGCILIVVKTGYGKSSFDRMAYEGDVLVSLLDDSRLKLFAVELLAEDKEPRHLEELAAAVNGRYVGILSEKDVESQMNPLIEDIAKIFASDREATTSSNTVKQVYRGTVSPNRVQEIQTVVSNVDSIKFRLTSRVKLDPSSIFLEPLEVPSYEKVILSPSSTESEWGETRDSTRRYVYSVTVSEKVLANAKSWRVYFVSNTDDSVLLQVLSEQTSVSEDIADDEITFDLSTTNEAEFAGPTGTPFTIFLSAHKLGQPVNKLEVRGTIHSYSTGESWDVPLLDDGRGDPDMYSLDGIYSASFAPPSDGNYQIFALVRNSGCTTGSDKEDKLILPDQGNIGCFPNTKAFDEAASACAGTIIRGQYSRIVTSDVFQVRSSSQNSVIGRPFRILDLEGATDNTTEMITLTFVSPKLFGTEASASAFRLYYASDIQKLATNPETYLLAEMPASPAGTSEYIQIAPNSAGATFLAVEVVTGDLTSGLSNIIWVKHHATSTSSTGRPTVIRNGHQIATNPIRHNMLSHYRIWDSPGIVTGVVLTNLFVVMGVILGMVFLFRQRIALMRTTTTDANENQKV